MSLIGKLESNISHVLSIFEKNNDFSYKKYYNPQLFCNWDSNSI